MKKNRWIATGVALVVALTLAGAQSSSAATNQPTPTTSPTSTAKTTRAASSVPPVVRAHRGGLHANLIENTALNFRAAKAEGRTDWEMDVRFTSTDVPVVLHDPDLRLFGCPTKNIASITTTTARSCAASNGQTISTLYEVLAELPTTGTVWAELKTNPTDAEWSILDQRLAGIKSRLVLESFLASALGEAKSHGYDTAFLSTTAVSPSALPAGTDWYAPAWETLTDSQVLSMHAVGVKVSGWTVDTLDRPDVPGGIDEILSNDPIIP